MAAWGRGCKAYIVAPNGVRPGASAAGPYTQRGTGILPVMFMAKMAMPRLELRVRRFALPALDGHAKAARYTGPDDEPHSKEPLIRFVPQHLLPREKDRDRGSGCPLTPPTPPYVRGRIRRFGGLS